MVVLCYIDWGWEFWGNCYIGYKGVWSFVVCLEEFVCDKCNWFLVIGDEENIVMFGFLMMEMEEY